MINPIGLPPWPLSLHRRYRDLRRLPSEELRGGVRVLRPRYRLIPAIGGRLNPAGIARAVLPLARRLHRQAPFAAVDAQFFYPDGPAAARLARALGLPLSIKARGSDIALWGAKAYARRAMLAAAEQAAGLLSVSQALKRDMVALGMPEAQASRSITPGWTMPASAHCRAPRPAPRPPQSSPPTARCWSLSATSSRSRARRSPSRR